MTPEEITARNAELDLEIAQEEKMWEVEQCDRRMITFNHYMQIVKVKMIVEILKDKLGITEEEVDMYFKEAGLAQLKIDRKQINKAKKAAANGPGGLMVPTRPQLLGPTGEVIL